MFLFKGVVLDKTLTLFENVSRLFLFALCICIVVRLETRTAIIKYTVGQKFKSTSTPSLNLHDCTLEIILWPFKGTAKGFRLSSDF